MDDAANSSRRPDAASNSSTGDAMLQLSEFLSNFQTPIIVLGILGNLLNLVTLYNVSPASLACCRARARKNNAQTAAMSLLVCMSAADLFMLLAQVPGFVHPHTYAHRFYECYLRSWMSNFGLTAVALFGACIAVERYAAVRNRERLVHFFHYRVGWLELGVTLFSMGVHVPRFFERAPDLDYSKTNECESTAYRATMTYQVLWYVTVLVNSVLPLLVMVSFASVVARTFMRIERQHKSMRMANANRAEERIALATRMMAVSIVVFAVSSIGGIITVIINAIGASHYLRREPAYQLFVNANNLLTSLKSSINFALYCTTSALYRQTLRNIVLCRKNAASAANGANLDAPRCASLNRSSSQPNAAPIALQLNQKQKQKQTHVQLRAVSSVDTRITNGTAHPHKARECNLLN